MIPKYSSSQSTDLKTRDKSVPPTHTSNGGEGWQAKITATTFLFKIGENWVTKEWFIHSNSEIHLSKSLEGPLMKTQSFYLLVVNLPSSWLSPLSFWFYPLNSFSLEGSLCFCNWMFFSACLFLIEVLSSKISFLFVLFVSLNPTLQCFCQYGSITILNYLWVSCEYWSSLC